MEIQLHTRVENGVYVIGEKGGEGIIRKVWDNRVATQAETTRPGEWCFCATEPTRTEIALTQGQVTIADKPNGGKIHFVRWLRTVHSDRQNHRPARPPRRPVTG